MHISKLSLPAMPLLLLLAGCATSSPQAARPAVQSQLGARTDLAATWPLTEEERAQAEAAVRDLLAGDLTVDSAVKVALLNNRNLRATFEELGLSQAALAAATRLPNPSFDASVRWPHDAPRSPNVEFGLTAPLLESLLLPARKQLAQDQLAQTQYRVSHEVLALAAEVRQAAYEALAQQELRARLAVIAEVNDAAADLARRQFEAGNIPQLELAQIQASAQQTQVELARADAEIRAARERLNRLLGLAAAQTGWKFAGGLPGLPADDGLPDDLEAIAVAQRLDLAALRSQAELARKALDLKRRTRLLPGGVDLGVDTEREPGGAGGHAHVTGPRLTVELPLFDQGQPELARLAAELRQTRDRAEALAADIGSEVRAARDRLIAARQAVVFYQQTLLPQRRTILRQSLLHYNAMQKSVYALLAAKEEQQLAEKQSIEALRDYWSARAELERALGRHLPAPAQASSEESPADPKEEPAAEHHHSHH
ncbi:MAG: TolC family protein [Verrucomicrobiota bacterium]